MDVFEKIKEQQGKQRTAVWIVGEQLGDMIRRESNLADIVNKDLDVPEMSLAECEKKINAYADKHKTGNFACVTPIEAEKIIREFYGLPGAEEMMNGIPQSAPQTAPFRQGGLGVELSEFF